MSNSSESEPTGRALRPRSSQPEDSRRVSLCEALDRMLNVGVVVAGEVVISVADIDLIYINVQLLLASVETAYGQSSDARPGPGYTPRASS